MCCFGPAAKVWASIGIGGVSAGGSPTFLLCQVLFPALGSAMSVFYLLVTSKQQTIVKWFNCKEFRQIFICSCSRNLSNSVLQLNWWNSGFCCKYLCRDLTSLSTCIKANKLNCSPIKGKCLWFLFVCLHNFHGSVLVLLGTFLKTTASCWGDHAVVFWKLTGQSMFWQ